MKRTILLSALLLSTAVACTDDEKTPEEAIEVTKEEKASKQNNDFKVDENGNVSFEAKIVYFKFDDHTLTEEGQSRLMALAEYMKSNPSKKLKIQGHCDERGSPQYNLALGERRSASVKQYLATLGVSDKNLETVSYGEEKPAVEGNNEEAWAKNRRATFVIEDVKA